MPASENVNRPSAISTDAAHMSRALELAARGLALASPNPQVGAVLVRAGNVIGEGFHTYDGIRHAETIAIANAGGSARGATLYVTLEPCCNTGRTPPCSQAVIAAGITRVVAAMPDPNPAVAGRGFEQLRAAGIEVSVGEGENSARRMNESFARWVRSRRPLITLKAALTLDGQFSLPRAPKKTASRKAEDWITSEESRAEVHRMRHASDALLTGIGTILADDPELTDRSGLPRRRPLLRVVLDSRLRLPPRSRLVRSANGDVLIFTRASLDSPKARALRRAGVEIVRLPGRDAHLDLIAVCKELGRRENLSALLEAGPALNSSALEAKIVDKMRLFYAPKVAGFASSNGFAHAGPVRELRRMTMAAFGLDFAVEGYLHDVYRAG